MTAEAFQSQFKKAWALRNHGNYTQVLAIAEEQLASAREAGDRASEALFLKLFAQVHSDKKELKESLSFYKQIERLYIELKDEVRQMHTLRHIGSLYHELKEFQCAEKCLVQVVNFVGSRSDMEAANTFRSYALALEGLGEKPRALEFWQKAKDIYQAHNIGEGVAECNVHLSLDG
ncbi:MAG: hypothetical protein HEP71_25235 [Roseivirga sp.]|nr:hypothetical protein [Roseivirga sp.]